MCYKAFIARLYGAHKCLMGGGFWGFECYHAERKMSSTSVKVHAQCVCTGGFKFPHYTCRSCSLTMTGFQTGCDVTKSVKTHMHRGASTRMLSNAEYADKSLCIVESVGPSY